MLLFGNLLCVPPFVEGSYLLILLCVFLPTMALSLLANRARREIMSEMPLKKEALNLNSETSVASGNTTLFGATTANIVMSKHGEFDETNSAFVYRYFVRAVPNSAVVILMFLAYLDAAFLDVSLARVEKFGFWPAFDGTGF
jgi:hypothetical protein